MHLSLLFTVGVLNLLAAMSPGPDFAIVTKNTIMGSRRAGYMTALGISIAVLIHISYCTLGLAWVITKTPILFNGIKVLGAAYLVYLGVKALIAKEIRTKSYVKAGKQQTQLSSWQAFREGFLTNLLNPKCTLFFLALFTLVIQVQHVSWLHVIIGVELFLIVLTWFSSLAWMLSHPRIMGILQRRQVLLMKMTGLFLIAFGIAMLFVHPA